MRWLVARVLRRPRLVLAVWGLVTVALAVNGLRVQHHISPTSIDVPGTPSQRAEDRADRALGSRGQAPILLQGPAGTVRAQAGELVAALRADHRNTVLSAFDPGAPPQLLARAGGAVILVQRPTRQSFAPDVGDAVRRAVAAHIRAPVRAYVSGFSVIGGAISKSSVDSAHSAELIALPILLFVLLCVFRSPLAALIPAVLGGATVASALGVVDIAARMGDVSDVAPPMASMMGLALGVDYSLLTVSRFREARRTGLDVARATELAALRAGRTAVIAATTILATMLVALLLAPGNFLQSAAIGASTAAVMAMIAATTAVPAALLLVGGRLERWRIGPSSQGDGAHWERFSGLVLRRPVLAALPAIAILGVLSVPGVGLDAGPPDVRVLPKGDRARTDTERVIGALGPGWSAPLEVYAFDPSTRLAGVAGAPLLARLRGELTADRDVALVLGPRVIGHTAVADIVPRSGPNAASTAALYDRTRARMRAFTAASGVPSAVGGVAAQLTDYRRAFDARLPLLVLALSGVAFVALVLVTRAILLPLISALLNAAVVGASFGVLALLSTGAHPPLGGAGFADALSLLALLALVFGLSLDYQVFILTRLREGWDASGRIDTAIHDAIVRTGPVVMGAAAIMAGVFLAFMTAPLQTIRQTGTGLVATVLLAASAVCLLAIPAAMRLAGSATFWLPRWLDRLLPHIDLEGTGAPPARALPGVARDGDPFALDLDLDVSPGQAYGSMVVDRSLSGPAGTARSVVIPWVFDQLFHAVSAENGGAVVIHSTSTAHRAPARNGHELRLRAWHEQSHGPRLTLRATIHDGTLLVAEAHATVLRCPVAPPAPS
jgi:putative drug exporter of the RND superfamily